MPTDGNGVARTPSGYFTHASAPPRFRPMQDATRYLCCAAYRDELLSQQLLSEFLDEEHRAVVPSYGFDLRPVLAHCLHARETRLIRDAVLTGVILIALILSWRVTVLVLVALTVLAIAVAMLPGRSGRFHAVVAIALLVIGGPILVFIGVSVLEAASAADPALEGQEIGTAGQGGRAEWLLGGLSLLILLLGIPAVHRLATARTLRSLGPDGAATEPRVRSAANRERIEQVGAAQYGNVTLYSRQNPFIGSGRVDEDRTRAWSLVIELDRARPARPGAPALPVDPVQLRKAIEQKLVSMRDELPHHESVGLSISDHVVAEGVCVQGRRPFDPAHPGVGYDGHPLIDHGPWRPFSLASAAAIDVLVRNPQADVRCYQRITLETHGSSVTDAQGRHMVPAKQEGVQITGFLYLAVQGRMLYAQFICNALPPIRKDYKVVDVLPSFTPAEIVLDAVRQAGFSAIGEAIAGPFHLAAAGWGAIFHRDRARRRRHFYSFDYGARMSVRERAAEPAFSTFLQKLDVNKHTRMFERRVLAALLDHLERDRNIDVSAYRAETASIISNSLIMNGGTVSGQVGFAPGGHVHQQATG
ncbi:hypothetical protein [Actinomadura opuntiae]|uniref:hypothetical protein n=1 Tax=Actinomadura sp. OS1-43 TaxID=604315 RepID=UPI00255A9BA0|nr:hypothetical protein [Actinomadura sp. OS1-43]MDL4820768.1 hypothetical protein [Actinomadura sp. OS1-43]